METLLSNAKKASRNLLLLSEEEKNEALLKMADALISHSEHILAENKKDIENAKNAGLKESMIERLSLDEKRIQGIADGIRKVAGLHSGIGETMEEWDRPNGLHIKKVRVPFGVIGVIFESRPNVCADVAALCLKASSACVLKGGKEAILTNTALCEVMREAIRTIVNPDVITLLPFTDRSATDLFITKKEYVDLLIPRGSKNLIRYVCENAKIPYIETGAGNCHLYVHEDADLKKAIDIAINAKYQRPSVCNAIEGIVVDEKIADKFLPVLYEEFTGLHIEMRGDEKTLSVIPVKKATEEDFYTEYNDYIVSIKVVSGIDEAIRFINEHSTKHSESIITESKEARDRFLNEIESACVYHNASTRFTDGGEFGFGAEIGISTDKLHARGPMGLLEITTYKYEIYGSGQVRK